MLLPLALLLVSVSAPASAVEPHGTDGGVTFRQGSLSPDQVEAWLRFRPPSSRFPAEEGRRRRIEERVLLARLDRQFAEMGLDRDPEAQGWHRLLERRLATEALRRAMAAEAAAAPAEIEAAFAADPHRFDTERRFQLQNLFKRWPPGNRADDRERLRREMAELRERLLAGADFEALAREESDSATRERGGNLGSAPLSALLPEVARVVASLAPGEVSPVVETAEGLTLLRCLGVVEATRLTPDQARERFGRELAQQRFDRAWDQLSTRLLAERDPAVRTSSSGDGPGRAIVTVRRPGASAGGSRERIDPIEFELFLRERRAGPSEILETEALRGHAGEFVLLEGRAEEAERRGLTRAPAFRERLELEALAMRGELALAPQVEELLVEPTESEMAELYRSRRERFFEPQRLHLRTLEIPIRSDLPAALYRRVRDLGTALEAGEIGLELAMELLAPHACVVDRGWMTERDAWQLGRNVEVALESLGVGRTSAPVQEGRSLLVLELVDRRDERPLELDEASDSLKASLLAAQRERIRARLREALLADAEIRIEP